MHVYRFYLVCGLLYYVTVQPNMWLTYFVGVLRPCSIRMMTGDELKSFKSQYRGTVFLFTPSGAVLGSINLLPKAFQWFFLWQVHQAWYAADQSLPTTAEFKDGYHCNSSHPCKFFWICSLHMPVFIVSNSGKSKKLPQNRPCRPNGRVQV